jgi:hypothetical protein
MLMLVVTIIIAAVVSAFAGGIGNEQHKTPQVSLIAESSIQDIQGTIDPTTYVLTYPAGFTAANGLLFENTGGDTFSLNEIEIQIQSEDTKISIKPTDTLPSASILTAGISNGGYFQKIGNTSLSDRMIAPGDKFMLYADGCARAVTYTGGSYFGPKISWRPDGAQGGFSVYLNKKLQYMVIDRGSSRVMASGDLILT